MRVKLFGRCSPVGMLVAVLTTALSIAPANQLAADDPVWGEYVGPQRGVQVAPRPDDEVEVVVFKGGLPGDGWDGSEPQRFLDVPEVAEAIVADMTRVTRQSPTIGAKPPSGAVVLYGTPRDALNWLSPGAHGKSDEDNAASEPKPATVRDGNLNGGVTSRQPFTDFTLHAEFLVPFQPERLGNFPGNSGIYIQDRYEIQILDDFGRTLRPNSCGSIYRQHEPRLNACYPPGQWQTFDIDFRAARFGLEGKKTANARMTVRQNGILLHENVEVAGVTAGNHLPENAASGPIHLQNHGDPVVFRNIWVLPIDEGQLAKRPIVSAFERFAGTAPGSEDGELLVSELACAACHKPEADAAWQFRSHGPDLTRLGDRVQPGWVAPYLENPHASKPGTKMPDCLAALDESAKKEAASELAAFLIGDRKSAEREQPQWFEASQGRELFNSIGCAACHQPAGHGADLATSVPLGDIAAKYTRSGLESFLRNPHAVRSSGRMPRLGLSDAELSSIASYLLIPPGMEMPEMGLSAAIFSAGVSDFRGFDREFKKRGGSAKRGPVADFNINNFGLKNNFLVRYEGTFTVKTEGEYRFRIGSDDGSRISVNGSQLVVVDGTHPYETAEGTLVLPAGTHVAQVDFFQAGGGMILTVEWSGPDTGGNWKPMSQAFLKQSAATDGGPNSDLGAVAEYQYSEELARRGEARFASLGCANCHSASKDVDPLVVAKPIGQLSPRSGCLSDDVAAGLPNYDLSSIQKSAIEVALTERAPVQPVRHLLAAYNCVACHVRDNVGGPEASRDAYFLTTIQEMGEEGRVPPMLDHVGDKLKADWLLKVLHDGQNVRPYMRTRMPAFSMKAPGQEVVGTKLADGLVAADRVVEAPLPDLNEGMHRTRTAGRTLVDNGGLACVKCHSFGTHKGLGIQAVNLLDMTSRLREDWVHRYIMNPVSLRPGTRMPSGFPNGKSVVTDLYGGDPSSQIAAIWGYLKEGKQAAVPKGLLPSPIELDPTNEPIIYRNFIQGLSPRGIAVGYPEGVNLAFDADRAALTLLWQNDFIDAAKHWRGRGPGFQVPMGDNVVTYQRRSAVALLASPDQAWPEQSSVKFLGYQLDEKRRPTFRYRVDGVAVDDSLEPRVDADRLGFVRTMRVSSAEGSPSVRLATATAFEQKDGAFVTPTGLMIRPLAGDAKVVTVNGQAELRVDASQSNGLVQYALYW